MLDKIRKLAGLVGVWFVDGYGFSLLLSVILVTSGIPQAIFPVLVIQACLTMVIFTYNAEVKDDWAVIGRLLKANDRLVENTELMGVLDKIETVINEGGSIYEPLFGGCPGHEDWEIFDANKDVIARGKTFRELCVNLMLADGRDGET